MKHGNFLPAVLCAGLAFFAAIPSLAGGAAATRGVWWWRGGDASDEAAAAKRLDFLAARGTTEIYFCADWKAPKSDVRRFVKAAGEKGIRVAMLAGDVSWIRPGSRGFSKALAYYLRYQREAGDGERFYAIHLDVEPHQDSKLSDARKWQLYADFVLRAAADVHAGGEKIEWDIPFWLDGKRVAYKNEEDAPLLEVLMDSSDTLALMSYRDSAKAILDVSKQEIEMAKTRKVKIICGAETGETGEGNFVTFYEEGAEAMQAELDKVCEALEEAGLHGGCGIAVHHVGSWEKLAARENREAK